MAKPWGRLELNFINHPKFLALTANAIALWLEGKNWSDMQHTDGLIPKEALHTFRFRGVKSIKLLTCSCGSKPDGTPYQPLWQTMEGFGFKMHDYLNHNDSRDVVLARIGRAEDLRDADRERKRLAREAKEALRVQSLSDRTNAGQTTGQTADGPRIVREMSASIHNQKQKQEEQTSSVAPAKKPPDPRVKDFLVWFQSEYKTRRHGAEYLVQWEKHGTLVKRMLGATELDRLKKYAQILLSDKTDEEFIVTTDRGIEILNTKFSWLSDRLATWEKKQQAMA